MNIVVLMPFNRPEFIEPLLHQFEGKDLTWIPCYDRKEIEFPDKPWITPFFSRRQGCWESLNEFIRLGIIKDDTWYQLAADDTVWHQNYWKELRKAFVVDAEVIVTAQYRHNCRPMLPSSSSLRLFNCDLSQFCIRGDILRTERFDEKVWCADGMMAERLAGRRIEYAPDAIHYYNALRPACWGYPESAQKTT